MEFTKNRKFAFFLITIMCNSQKYYIFAPNLKYGTKLQIKIHTNKLKFKKYEQNTILRN